MDNVFGRGLLNGWQLSGISSLASGIPLRLSFTGDAGGGATSAAYFGTADVVGPSNTGGNGLAPVYTCDPRLDGKDVGEKLLDINCISVPAFGELGELVPPYNLRTPTRTNTDLTLFKNFEIKGDQKLQFRVGFFNIFNQAFANTFIGGDVDLTLDTALPGARGRRAERRRRHRRRLRRDQGLRLHAADDRQLRRRST